MVQVTSGFRPRKNLSENCSQFWHSPSETFASPVQGRKEYQFEAAPIY
jgi:hypothetical protein